jgi:hypothetical protein
MTRVWRQVRSVEAGPVSLDELDLDIRVRKPKDDSLEFDVRTWNLPRSTWDRIEDGDLVRIELGWEEGDREGVCLGPISNQIPTPDGNDIQYRLKGVDESEAATGVIPGPEWSQKSWKNRDPAQIAAAIAEPILSTGGVIVLTAPIGGKDLAALFVQKISANRLLEAKSIRLAGPRGKSGTPPTAPLSLLVALDILPPLGFPAICHPPRMSHNRESTEALFRRYIRRFPLPLIELPFIPDRTFRGAYNRVSNLSVVVRRLGVSERLHPYSRPHARFLCPHTPTPGTRPATAVVCT